MFTHTQYVPVLRWRMAEWCALKDLDTIIKRKITPVIELLPKDFEVVKKSRKKNSYSQIIENKVVEMADHWGTAPYFLDFNYIEGRFLENGTPIQEAIANIVSSKKLKVTPVIYFKNDRSLNNIMRNVAKILRTGVCLRIHPIDFRNGNFQRNLSDVTSFFNLSPENIDLIIDNQIHGPNSIGMKQVLAQLPDLLKWRTLSLIGGSFPIDLSNFSVGEHELFRDDYKFWLTQIRNRNCSRLPAFGDYTVQHPVIRELSSYPNLSASIRYTSDNYWVIMRGQGVRNPNGSGYAQWPANAAMLSLRNEFCGQDFSKGDKYIYEMGGQNENTGNATTWIRAGINHHLTFVVKQLANHFGS